jgi:hypothetical protein
VLWRDCAAVDCAAVAGGVVSLGRPAMFHAIRPLLA